MHAGAVDNLNDKCLQTVLDSQSYTIINIKLLLIEIDLMFLIERKFVRHLVRLSPSRTRIPPATGTLRAMPRLKPVNRPLRYV